MSKRAESDRYNSKSIHPAHYRPPKPCIRSSPATIFSCEPAASRSNVPSFLMLIQSLIRYLGVGDKEERINNPSDLKDWPHPKNHTYR